MTNSNNYNLTGGDFASGGAIDDTQTDIVNVNGDGNFFFSLGRQPYRSGRQPLGLWPG